MDVTDCRRGKKKRDLESEKRRKSQCALRRKEFVGRGEIGSSIVR